MNMLKKIALSIFLSIAGMLDVWSATVYSKMTATVVPAEAGSVAVAAESSIGGAKYEEGTSSANQQGNSSGILFWVSYPTLTYTVAARAVDNTWGFKGWFESASPNEGAVPLSDNLEYSTSFVVNSTSSSSPTEKKVYAIFEKLATEPYVVSFAAYQDGMVTYKRESDAGDQAVDANGVDLGFEAGVHNLSLTATAAAGSKFIGWYVLEGEQKKYISYDATLVRQVKGAETLGAEFVPATTPIFQVNGTTTRYAGLAAALEGVGSQTATLVLVDNGTVPAGEYTIPRSVTLLIPYKAPSLNNYSEDSPVVTSSSNPLKPYRDLTLDEGVQLWVKGKIKVAASLYAAGGGSGYHPCGSPVDFGVIRLPEGSSIVLDSGAQLDCYGYIVGDGQVVAHSGSAVNECLQFRYFMGGNVTLNLLGNQGKTRKYFPITQYYIQNVQSELVYESGATSSVKSCFVASGAPISGTARFIGGADADAMFALGSGKLTKRYIPEQDRLSIVVASDTTPSQVKGVKLGISSYNFNSTERVLPITHNWDVRIKSGEVDFMYDVALLPDSVLKIDQNAKVVVSTGASMFVYDETDWNEQNFAVIEAPQRLTRVCRNDGTFGGPMVERKRPMGPAQVCVNGSLEVLGSLYTTRDKGAKIRSTQSGRVSFQSKAATAKSTYQYVGTAWGTQYFFAIPAEPAWLNNDDGSLVSTASAVAGDVYTYTDGVWSKPLTLTVPTVENAAITSVKVKDVAVELDAANKVLVAPGSSVEIVYTANEGYTFAEGATYKLTCDAFTAETVLKAPTVLHVLTVTLPTVDNATVSSVKVNGEAVEPVDGQVMFVSGAALEVTYQAAAGWFFGEESTYVLNFDAVTDPATIKAERTPVRARVEKFYMGVSGKNPWKDDALVTVDATVYADYGFKVQLPSAATEEDPYRDGLGADWMKVTLRMTDVDSLQVAGTREITREIETGVPDIYISLSDHLLNTYVFDGASVTVAVKDATGTQAFNYQLSGLDEQGRIFGTPSSEEAARAAWALLASKVETSVADADDTHVFIKKGAYIQIGDERLTFTRDIDLLQGDWSMEDLFSDIEMTVSLGDAEGNSAAEVFLPVGSTLGVGQSAATLLEDARLTVNLEGVVMPEQIISGLLADLEAVGELRTKVAIVFFVDLLDDVVGLVDEATSASVTLEFSTPKEPKFYLGVMGRDPDTQQEVVVDASVYADYGFVVQLPVPGMDYLGMNWMSMTVQMKDVDSLGVEGTREITRAYDTGLPEVPVELSSFLVNTYDFGGAEIGVRVTDASHVESFAYNLAGMDVLGRIVGTASNEADARAAWALLASKVETVVADADDSHIFIKKGAYVQIGTERLTFTRDVDLLKGDGSLEALFTEIEAAVVLIDVKAATSAAEVFLPMGSTLGLGQSAATLKEDARLTVNLTGVDVPEQVISGLLTDLESAGEQGTKVAILFFVDLLDDVVGLVDEATSASVTLEFSTPKEPKFYLGVMGRDPDTQQEVVVDASVYADYGFVVQLPVPGMDSLGMNWMSMTVQMKDVDSLGVEGTREITRAYDTGLPEVPVALSSFLVNTYDFGGAEIGVAVKDAKDEKSFTYELQEIDELGRIIGTASSEADARAAWALLASKVETAVADTDDSHVLIKRGAYVQIGDERLTFMRDVDLLQGDWSVADLFSEVEQSVALGGAVGDSAAEVFLPMGSTLGLGQSAATLLEDARLTVNLTGVDVPTQVISGLLSDLESAGELRTKVAILFFVGLLDDVVGLVDAAESASVTLKFSVPEEPKFYLGVTGVNPQTSELVTVDASVYADFGFKVRLPAADVAVLSPSWMAVTLRMTDVASLDVTGTREFSAEFGTGIDLPYGLPLDSYLSNCYNFGVENGGVSVPVTVKDETETKSFTYTIAPVNVLGEIEGTADDVETARAAWALLASKVTTSVGATDDSHVVLKKGTSIRIGDEQLTVTTDLDLLKGEWSFDSLFGDVADALELAPVTLDEDAPAAEICLPAGTTLAVGQSTAVLEQNARLAVQLPEGKTLPAEFATGYFTALQDDFAANGELLSKFAVALVIRLVDQVVGLVDDAGGASVTLEFTEPDLVLPEEDSLVADVVFPRAWVKEQTQANGMFTEMTDDAILEELQVVQPNGAQLWQNLVMGVDGEDPKSLMARFSKAEDSTAQQPKTVIGFPQPAVPVGDGVKVTYTLMKGVAGAAGAVVVPGVEPSDAPTFKIPLPTELTLYHIMIKIEKAAAVEGNAK